MLAVVWEGASLVRECQNGWVGGDEAEAIPLRIARNQVAGAKAFNPKGLWRQHPTRVCWLAWRGFGGQDHGTRPRVQAMYQLCAIYMLAIAPEVDRINLGSNS